LPRLQLDDPQLTSLKIAARAAVVMPAVFAVADKVIQDPQTALSGVPLRTDPAHLCQLDLAVLND